MTVKMGNFRMALLAALSSHASAARVEYGEAEWWGSFVREMEAIGCINIRQNADGEFDFDCPQERLEDAKRIVNRYKVQHA